MDNRHPQNVFKIKYQGDNKNGVLTKYGVYTLLDFFLSKPCKLSGFPIVWFECIWWRWFQKRVVRTKFDIYVFILSLGRNLSWWTISPRRYHSPSSRCFRPDIVY